MSKIIIEMDYCDGSEYVFIPACLYNGNRFDVLKKDYPPFFSEQEAKTIMPVTITDVPRLNKVGSGKIEVTTGDAAVPCVGVFFAKEKKAMLVFTVQEIDGKNIGLAYERGKITLSYPAYRENAYRHIFLLKNEEPYEDIPASIPYKEIRFDCESMEEFYYNFFINRKCMGLDDAHPQVIPFSEQLKIQTKKFNKMNWCEDEGYYAINTSGGWEPGWVGGGIMAGYALMKTGGELEARRAMKTMEFLFKNQSDAGVFCHAENAPDIFGIKGRKKWGQVRQIGDCLYFAFKQFNLMDNIPDEFISKIKKTANLFVDIWEKYEQFGQYIDSETSDIVIGGSTSGALIPAGLVMAYRFFKNEKFLQTAKESAEFMMRRDALNGYTTGGPTEILSCPDSESAFLLLESMCLLYEETLDHKWLSYAEYMAHLCSSWVVSYNYKFPKTSQFGQLDIKTIGSVFANIQNKHSSPGICTLSGDSLRKLYEWTGNILYKKLFDDITLTLGQYISTYERPIYSWDMPKDAEDKEPYRLPSGFINERVNMSDWEWKEKIGEVFYGSCWCETSNLLILAECISNHGKD